MVLRSFLVRVNIVWIDRNSAQGSGIHTVQDICGSIPSSSVGWQGRGTERPRRVASVSQEVGDNMTHGIGGVLATC